jgi:ABC-type nitrate/sulfonate/bicarbonate transport system substrate-binding protein
MSMIEESEMSADDARRTMHGWGQRRHVVAAAFVAASLVAVAACSSSGSSSSSQATTQLSGTGSSAASPLTVALGAVSAEAAAVYIAQVEGYFAKEGVTVNVELQPGAEASTDVLAGRADIAFTGATSALSPAVKGKQTQFIFATITGPGNASLLVTANSKYNSLQSLSGQQVSTQGVSGASWGETQALSHYNATHGGSAFNVVPLGSSSLQADAVIAGRNAAAGGGPDLFGAQIAAGKMKVLVGPDSEVVKSLFPSDLLASGLWGLASDFHAKSQSVTKFLTALLMANDYINSHSVGQVAAVMAKDPLYQGYSLDAVQTAVSVIYPYLTPTDGAVSEQAWTDSLKTYADWGLGIDLSSSALDYSTIINSQLLSAAKAAKQ